MAVEEHVGHDNEEGSSKGVKRKREPSVLDNFTKLTNCQDSVRLKAGVELLKYLGENKTQEKEQDELKYALGRLIRGLGSSAVNTKIGFFATLVAVLNLKTVTVGEVFEYVEKELRTAGSNSKSENADVSSGQILVAGAVLRSNMYMSCSDEEKSKCLGLLLNAGKERTYLALASYTFLIDLFEKINAKEFENLVFPLIKAELSKQWPIQNLDSLYLLLKVHKSFPTSLHPKFLKNNLGTTEIVCLESLPHICNALMAIPRISALKHPIFELWIEIVSKSDVVVEFFEELDRALARPNRNRHFVATKLITGALEDPNDPAIIPDILTKNYIQQTISTFRNAVGKQRDREFEAAMQKLFETLLTGLKRDRVGTETKIEVLNKLMFFPGIFVFEKIARSRVLQNVVSTLDADGAKKLAATYREIVLGEKDRQVSEERWEAWRNSDRIYAARLLVKLINHPSMHEETDWKVEQLSFLARIGLSKTQSEELTKPLREAFYSALDLKLTKLNDTRLILSRVFDEADAFAKALAEEHRETWKRTAVLVKKLEGRRKKKSAVFHALFLNLGLQIFGNAKLATDSLNELFSCYERTKKSKKVEDETSADDPCWIEVVTDLFLNLLSHNSHLLRSVINCVFPRLCKYMNATAIHQILSVLDPKNEDNPLTKTHEEEESDESEEGSESEDEQNEDSSHEDDTDEEADENVNDKLRTALHQVLSGDVDSDAESVDLDEMDAEEGEKLNEALGRAFRQFRPNLGRGKKQRRDDEALTHFRIRVLDLVEIYINSNPSMILTLEIMLPLLQCLEFCIKDEHQKPLQDRVKVCLKKLTSLREFCDCDEVTEEVLVDLLRSLLEKGTRNALIIQEMSEKISECCLLVVYCSQVVRSSREASGLPKKRLKCPIEKVIEEGLEAFFTRRDCVIPYVLFKSVLQLNWDGIMNLLPFLTGYVFASSTRPFRRNQAVDLLKIFYHNHRFISAHLPTAEKLKEDTSNFLRDCLDFFKEFSTNHLERKIKEKYFGNLFELLSIIRGSPLGNSFDSWVSLGEAIRETRSGVTFSSRDTKLAFNKLCKCLSISYIVQMKQTAVKLNNVEEEEGEENEHGKKKKEKKHKRSLDKSKLKLKKESKKLRLQSLSEGFNKRKVEWESLDDNKRAKVS